VHKSFAALMKFAAFENTTIMQKLLLLLFLAVIVMINLPQEKEVESTTFA
jgi:hypothetical protein